MASPQPPPRPRAEYPNPNPNSIAGSMQNMQIGNRPQPPFAGAHPPSTNPFGPRPTTGPSPMSRPGPPPASSRPVGPPPPFASARPSSGPIASNGPLVAPPMRGARPFVGNPPAVAPLANQATFSAASQMPFSGASVASQTPFSGVPVNQPTASGSPVSQPAFSGSPVSQPAYSGAPSSQPAFSGASLAYRPPPFSQGALPSRPEFPGPPSSSQPPVAGPVPTSQPPFTSAPPTARGPFAGPPPPTVSTPLTSQTPFSGALHSSQSPPFASDGGPLGSQHPYGGAPPMSRPLSAGALPSSQPFSGMPPPPPQQFGGPQMLQGQSASAGPYASPPWSSQAPQAPPQGIPPMPGTMPPPPPRMYGMSAQAPVSPMMSHSPVSTPSKIDPNQIPRPMPSSSVIIFDTRQGGVANIPPPATSDFIVRDTGNCSPRYMRCTINQVPCTGDLLSTSAMPLSLLIQPFALPHPSEEPIQVVDFGESGPLRCSRCKGYINPFMKFIDQGRRFICNLCGFTDETPRDYHCNLGPDGRRRDADERPELCRGTVEFVATKEYMSSLNTTVGSFKVQLRESSKERVAGGGRAATGGTKIVAAVKVRDPMPAVFFFLVDVSMNAIQTGATAAACSAISQAIADLPEGPRTMVGVATFDSTIHFYNLKRSLQQPLMLIVPDVQDVYTPLHSDIIVQLSECRQHLEQLLENIPTMFESNKISESALCAAMKASFLAMKPTGGKLLVFQSVLPSVGYGSLSSREAEGRANISSGEKEARKLLQPADKILKTMAIEFAEYQVCVDIFISSQTYLDIASVSVVPRTTGGQVYYYYPFSALSDSAKLYNDLRWNITRPQGFEAVMRVRCSQGLQVQEYFGNFCKRIPTDIDLPGIDCDKTIMVTFKHDDKFKEGAECAFQCALLYTTVYGQRRIRVTNLSLPCTSMLSNLFRSADLDSQFACFLKQAANDVPRNPLSQIREQIINLCINTLHSYRRYCATVSSSGQLILPEALKLLPLYTLALNKSVGLRTDGRLDDRSYWVNRAVTLSTAMCVPLVYPRMIAIHNLASAEDGLLASSTIPLSSEHVMDDGIYLLENGEDAFVYVGNSVNPDIMHQVFGASSIDAIPSQFMLEQFDNELSRKINDVINEIRRQRSSYLRLRLCKKGDPSGMPFFSYMIEDKSPGGLSYVEFLVHVHRQIQTKMA